MWCSTPFSRTRCGPIRRRVSRFVAVPCVVRVASTLMRRRPLLFQFMYECVMALRKVEGTGAILADEM